MSQYTPIKTLKYNELNTTINFNEYEELLDYAYTIGTRKAYIQESESSSESFIPVFDNEGV